jgi:hypothetical protein
MLKTLEDWPPLVGEHRWGLIVHPSFRPPWRFWAELRGEAVAFELSRWSIRSRAETGDSEFAMLDRCDQAAPLRETGSVPLQAANEIRALRASEAASIADANEEGIMDGWTAWCRVESKVRVSQFKIRISLHPNGQCWSAFPRQIEFLQQLYGFARRTSRSFSGQWALDALDDIEPQQLPEVHLLHASPAAVRLTKWDIQSERTADALRVALPATDEAILEVLPIAIRATAAVRGLRAALAERPATKVAVPDSRRRQALVAEAPELGGRIVDDADRAYESMVNRLARSP